MEKSRINFRKEILKGLFEGKITKVEAKECLKRGIENQEIPIFFDSSDNERTPIMNYVLGLEKLGFPIPFIVFDEDLRE